MTEKNNTIKNPSNFIASSTPGIKAKLKTSTSSPSKTRIKTPLNSTTSSSTPAVVPKIKTPTSPFPKTNTQTTLNPTSASSTPISIPTTRKTSKTETPQKSIPIQKIKTAKIKPKTIPSPVPTQIHGTNFKTQFLEKMKSLRFDAIKEKLKKRDDNLIKILNNFTKEDKITNNKVEDLLNISDRSASRYLRILYRRGKISKHGRKKGTFYQKYT